MSAAQYRILSPAGEELESGSGDASVADGAFVLAPASGPACPASLAGSALRVPFAHIASVGEPQPFTVRLTLADGNAIELSRLGAMRTQLLAELRDGRGDDLAAAASAVGSAAVFSGTVSGGFGGAGGAVVEIRVYEDAMLVLADDGAATERVGFSFIDAVQARDYAVTVSVAGRSPVVLGRLGRRTDELVSLLSSRLQEARGRTAAFLGALLPGLDPMALRAAAGLLRDGVAAPARLLDGIHPDLASTLLRVATLPDRYDAVAALAREADVAIGFKQLASVRKDAVGATPWRDPSVTPHIGEHESPGGLFKPGLGGVLAAEVASGLGPGGSGGGFGGYGGYGGYGYGGPFGEVGGGYGVWGAAWALRALGAGMNASQSRPMTPRADVTRGLLTPETDDLSALTATGDNPTVLAFALCRKRPGAGDAGDAGGLRVAYEVLNKLEPVTFVYQADGGGDGGGGDGDGGDGDGGDGDGGDGGGDGGAAINRALDDAGFNPAAVHAEGLTAAARPGARASLLARALIAQVPHDADWARAVAGLLAG